MHKLLLKRTQRQKQLLEINNQKLLEIFAGKKERKNDTKNSRLSVFPAILFLKMFLTVI